MSHDDKSDDPNDVIINDNIDKRDEDCTPTATTLAPMPKEEQKEKRKRDDDDDFRRDKEVVVTPTKDAFDTQEDTATSTATETKNQSLSPKKAVDDTSPSVRFEARDNKEGNINSKKNSRENKADRGDDGYDAGDETIENKLGPKAILQDYKDRRLRGDFAATRTWLLERIPEELCRKERDDFPVCFLGRYFYMEDEPDTKDEDDGDLSADKEEDDTTKHGSTKTSSMIVRVPPPNQDCRAVLRCCKTSGEVLRRFASRQDVQNKLYQEYPEKNRDTVRRSLDKALRGVQNSLYGHLYRYGEDDKNGEKVGENSTDPADDSGEDTGDDTEQDLKNDPLYSSRNPTTRNGDKKQTQTRLYPYPSPVVRCCIKTNKVIERFASRQAAKTAISNENPEKAPNTIERQLTRTLNGELDALYGYNYRYATPRPVLRCCATSGQELRRFACKGDAIIATCQENPERYRRAVRDGVARVLKGTTKIYCGHVYRYARDSEYETDDEGETISPTRRPPRFSPIATSKTTSGQIFRRSIASGKTRRFATRQDAVKAILEEFPDAKERSVRSGIYQVLADKRKTCFGYEYSFEDTRAVLRRSHPSGAVLARFPTLEAVVEAILKENPKGTEGTVLQGIHHALRGKVRKPYLGHQYSYESDSADIDMETYSQEEEATDDEPSSHDEIEAHSSSREEYQEVGKAEVMDERTEVGPRSRQQRHTEESRPVVGHSLTTPGNVLDTAANGTLKSGNEPLRQMQVILRTSECGDVMIFPDKRTAARALAEASDMGGNSEDTINLLEKGIANALNSDHDTYMHFKFRAANMVVGDNSRDGQGSAASSGRQEDSQETQGQRRRATTRKESPSKARSERKTKRRKLARAAKK